jgi:hypothetical protein
MNEQQKKVQKKESQSMAPMINLKHSFSHQEKIFPFVIFPLPFNMWHRLVSNGPLLSSFRHTLVSFGSHLASFLLALGILFTQNNP